MPGSLKPPSTPKLGSSLGSTLGSTLGTQSTGTKDISKVGTQATAAKMPKAKKPGDAFAPPSVFFKSESESPKHPSLRNLWDFMNKRHKSKAENKP
jgi:hypothetical protein